MKDLLSDGCHVHTSCFTCPLAKCIFEIDHTRALHERDRAVAQYLASGHTVDEAAQHFEVNRRTVYRALQRIS